MRRFAVDGLTFMFLWLRPFGLCPLAHRVPDPPCWLRHPFWYQRG